MRLAESVANVIGSAIERSEAEQTIRHQAMHDALTGIPNRALLHDPLQLALDRAERDRTLVGLLYIDLDRFKDVIDGLVSAYPPWRIDERGAALES